MCKGESETYSSILNRTSKGEDKFEMSFDDSTNRVLSLSVRHAFACHPSQRGPKGTCDCKVTDNSVVCTMTNDSDKDPTFKQDQTIQVNRFTGMVKLFSAASWMDAGKNVYLQQSANMKCEAFTEKRF